MDFFEHQEQARKQTGRLVVLFIVAVIAILVLVYFAVVIALWIYDGWQSQKTGQPAPTLTWWQPTVLFWSSLATLAVIGVGTAVKIHQLRQGGGAVAEMLGGRQIDPASDDPDERKVLNVVEEMAIASGTAVPPVYLMPNERGINAFAAGFTPDDAVIGITRGAIYQLDRDELQGVIAHEFSHILNSDMRTNIHLMGVIHGIVVISIIGLTLVRVMFYGAVFGAHQGHHGGGGDRDRGGGGGKAMLAIAALGVALLIIGAVGSFFGKLIKAAVSRQREYLADAAAVQFTRYPEGLAGALKKIGGLSGGARMRSARAEEASHMFFGQAFRSHLGSLFATHPPLPERIQKLDPSFNGEFEQIEPTPGTYGEAREGRRTRASGYQAGQSGRGVGRTFTDRVTAAMERAGTGGGNATATSESGSSERGADAFGDFITGAMIGSTAGEASGSGRAGGGGNDEAGPEQRASDEVDQAEAKGEQGGDASSGQGEASAATESGIGRIGNPSPEHLQYATDLIRHMPQVLKDAAHESYGARALIYALLLDPGDEVRRHQLEHLEASADPQVYKMTRGLIEHMSELDPAARIPLLDMAVPALRELSPSQYTTFKQNFDALVQADDKISLFEWMLQRTLSRFVAPDRRKSNEGKVKHKALDSVRGPCAVLLSTLAYIGHSDQAAAQHAFEQARSELSLDTLELRATGDCDHQSLDEALTTLATLAPKAKRSLLNACAACIAADKEATRRETELLRLVSDSLGCPMPPVLPGQPLR